jgi:hypothetical protein
VVSQPGSSGTGRWNSRRRCGQTTRDGIARTITARVGSHSVQWDDERAREARLHAASKRGYQPSTDHARSTRRDQHEHESRTHLARIGGSRKRRISDAFSACARVLLVCSECANIGEMRVSAGRGRASEGCEKNWGSWFVILFLAIALGRA